MIRCRHYTILSFIAISLLALPCKLYGQDKVVYDSTYVASVTDSVKRYIATHPWKFKPAQNKFRMIPYFGAFYSEEREFGATVGYVAHYRTGMDTISPLSITSTIASISTNLSYLASIKGVHYSVNGSFLLEYGVRYSRVPRRFWGLGYDSAVDDNNRSSFTEDVLNVRIETLYRPFDRWTLGPVIGFNYYSSSDYSSPDLIAGNPLYTRNFKAGLKIAYDSRDNFSDPQKGIFLKLEQLFNFSMFDRKPYYNTILTADFFIPAWKGAVIAIDTFGDLNFGDTPWMMWPVLGGETRMRGYYEGRFRDKNMLSAQLELRQHIYKGHGIVAWGGAGNVFPSFSQLDTKHTLPTYGVGYRFKFWGIILRADVGFGLQGCYSIIVGINNAF